MAKIHLRIDTATLYARCMETICLHITGEQSIKLMRAARVGKVVSASPLCNAHISPTALRGLDELRGVGLGTLLDWLSISPSNPLKLSVPCNHQRIRTREVCTSALSEELPDGALLQLHSGTDKESAITLPPDVIVCIDSPSLAFVKMSHELGPKAAKEGNEGLTTSLRLIEFACECCGAYVRDPFTPRTTIIHYDEPGADSRFCNLSDMRTFASSGHKLHGKNLALKMLAHAIDGSGSGIESYLNLALAGAPRLGGLAMHEPLVNQQLVIDEDIKQLLKHKSIRPDMQWPDYQTLVEYLGDEAHASKKARVEDKDRLQDYATAGYTTFSLMFDDVRSAAALNRTAEMIARSLMQHGKRNELYRVRHLLKDDKFLSRQSQLIATLLPPITRYDS